MIAEELYCLGCHRQRPLSQLIKLSVLWKSTDGEPNPEYQLRGRFCTACIGNQKEELRLRGVTEFKEETYVPTVHRETLKS